MEPQHHRRFVLAGSRINVDTVDQIFKQAFPFLFLLLAKFMSLPDPSIYCCCLARSNVTPNHRWRRGYKGMLLKFPPHHYFLLMRLKIDQKKQTGERRGGGLQLNQSKQFLSQLLIVLWVHSRLKPRRPIRWLDRNQNPLWGTQPLRLIERGAMRGRPQQTETGEGDCLCLLNWDMLLSPFRRQAVLSEEVLLEY